MVLNIYVEAFDKFIHQTNYLTSWRNDSESEHLKWDDAPIVCDEQLKETQWLHYLRAKLKKITQWEIRPACIQFFTVV